MPVDQRAYRLQKTIEVLSEASNSEEFIDALQSLKLLLQGKYPFNRQTLILSANNTCYLLDRNTVVPTDTINLLFSLLGYEDGYVVELSSSCIALVLAKEDYNQVADAYQVWLTALFICVLAIDA
jgi:hypothetical protein